jgi:hypothetical protein
VRHNVVTMRGTPVVVSVESLMEAEAAAAHQVGCIVIGR